MLLLVSLRSIRFSNCSRVCLWLVFLQDMYFKYIWNNFLHIQVEICTAMILAMPPAQSETPEINREQDQEPVRENHLIKHVRIWPAFFSLSLLFVLLPSHIFPISNQNTVLFPSRLQLFQKCQLLQRILDAWGSNEKEQ